MFVGRFRRSERERERERVVSNQPKIRFFFPSLLKHHLMATSEAKIRQEMEADKFGSSKGQAWFCTTGLPSDVVIEVDDMSFHLHKFPLMSKSRKIHQLINEQERNSRTGGNEEYEEGEKAEEEKETHHITIPEFPGGSEAFEVAAKFCYGVKIDLTPWNVAPLRCAAEYLDMAEDYAEDNLVSRTERFLAQSVLRGLKESLQTLKSCEDLMPLAEDLGIVRRCVESIAARACSSDPGSLFGWPVNERATSGGDPINILWNGIDTGAPRRRSGTRSSSVTTTAGSWLEDLAILSLPIYKRVIDAMRAADPRSEVLEGSLVSYAKRSIPGLSRSSRKHASAPIVSEAEQRELLETVIGNLPVEKTEGGLTTAKFLFRLLRTVNILRASEETRTTLERRIASQLEQATVDDLLMPSYSYLTETLYDVDCAERILGYFLEGEGEGLEERSAITAAELPDGGARLTRVGKLVDGYLAEIASDANLKPDKFCDLALAIPGHARVYDDGLYRAVDVYLKAHPGMGEEEREKVCGVMECQKLTLEACTHAAQNERLPLRAVVQVLFFEQLQLRRAIAGTLLSAEPQDRPRGERRSPSAAGEGETWRSAVRENQVMRLDMDSMRNRVHELERECSSMRKKIERIDRGAGPQAAGGDSAAGGWGSFTRKFGCKFKTQVCDSHERTVVESRRRDPAERSP